MGEEGTSFGWWIGLSSAITALVTLLSTKGVDAIIRMRKAGLDEREYEDRQAVKGYETLIGELTKRIVSLESQLNAVQTEHLECIKVQERLKGQNDRFGRELDILSEEVKGLRQWRHEVANQAQAAALKTALKEEQQKVV